MSGKTLYKASRDGNIAEVQRLIAEGVDVNSQKDVGFDQFPVPLHGAAERGHVEVIKVLIDAKANIDNAENFYLVTPLHAAAKEGNVEAMKLLIDAKANLNVEDGNKNNPRKWTPLHVATDKGDVEATKLLIDAKANPNAEDRNKMTPLFNAATQGTWHSLARRSDPSCRPPVEAMKLLIEAKANPNAETDIYKETPLHAVAGKGDVEATKLLIDAKANPNAEMDYKAGKPAPLHLAAKKGSAAAMKVLIDAKANIEAEDAGGRTPLLLSDSVEAAQMLIELGVSPIHALAKASAASSTALFVAVAAYDEETLSRLAARYLIAHGVKKPLVDFLTAAEQVLLHANNVYATDPSASDESRTLSARLQLIAAKLLSFEKDEKDRRGRVIHKVDELLFGKSSADALTIALRGEAKVFTMQPVVVQAVRRVWLGVFIRFNGPGQLSVAGSILILFNVIAATVFLPLTALYPPLADRLNKGGDSFLSRAARPEYTYSSGYILATPIVKYVVASACECTLALLLTLPSTAWLADPLHGYLLLAWVTSSLAWEIRQMVFTAGTTVWTRASAYWADRFNRIDLPAILFTLAALVSAIVLDGGNAECGKPATDLLSLNLMSCPPPSIQTSTLRAFAAFLLCLRVLRMLLVFPGLGPYILMVFRMLQDVRKFLAILVVAVLSFTAAFFNLYEPAPTVRSTPTKGWPFLGSEPTCINYMDTFSSALVRLLEASVTGDNFFECVRDSTHPISGWFWSFLFYAALGLLLLNMLIAMMAKTFDNVYEAAIPNFRYLFTQMVHSLKEQPPWPPPLYLLTLPYECYQIVKWCQLVPARRADLYRKRKGVTENTADNEMTAKIELEKSEDELARELTEYIQNNQDDVAQEERWRTIWKKDMSAKFAKQQEQLTVMREHQQEQLTDMKSQLMDMEAHMRVHMNNQLNILNALLEHHGLPTPSQAEFEPPVASAPPPHRSHTSLDDEAAHTLSDEAATADDDGSNGEAAIPEASHGRMISTDT